ncbi:OLC1v1010143C1 [Oldenlandia corymbosa var. corymbosa]|uniref:OLC1v1010143C1 n=1 Tax=Oldenlandia corymbosa var. corymbosa TaxID=529605 RepID=A0AAV1DR82_OLDCO|nr:OLC1v1010143C1 [Oldenlandia corymbosa var. corymbosa]
MDPTDTPLSTSPSHSNFSPQRHFYLAVDRLQFKMETLVDLLSMAGRRPSIPMVVCCSTRDELDSVCSAVSNLSYISIATLYSDLAEAERASILENFRQATMVWNKYGAEDKEKEEEEKPKSHMVIVTDSCLPLLGAGESPISARILINYELPTKKETYMRRMAACLAADGIVINMVVGGEVVTLKNIEESSGLVIAEMPIHVKAVYILLLVIFPVIFTTARFRGT